MRQPHSLLSFQNKSGGEPFLSLYVCIRLSTHQCSVNYHFEEETHEYFSLRSLVLEDFFLCLMHSQQTNKILNQSKDVGMGLRVCVWVKASSCYLSFHDLTSLHPPSFQRNDFSPLVKLVTLCVLCAGYGEFSSVHLCQQTLPDSGRPAAGSERAQPPLRGSGHTHQGGP